jgi:purine-binding chemotaxis protein CheW
MKMEIVEEKTVQYCGFKIGNEEYAIPVMEVQEVIKPQMVTPIPLAQEQIRGIINLRGQIVTCISLRKLFGQEDDLSKDHMNIIVRGADGLFSLVVDEVTDIIDIKLEDLERSPDTINPNLKKYVDKIFKRNQGLVILLKIKELIALKPPVIHNATP